MVSDRIKDYTKANPYELRWRFDFDNSLVSVCNINGEDYDKSHLSDEDKEHIEMAYCYLKSLQAFIKSSGCLTEAQKHELASDDTPSYIDYVNLGWANEDGNTYSFAQYWETSNGVKSFAYEEFDAPLSEEGLFQFGLYTFPCMTRVIENGIVTMDYREQNPHLMEANDMSKWAEIRNDYCDEEEGKIFIDAWKTDGGSEEGVVIAKVSYKTKEVEYLNNAAKTDSYAQEVIAETLESIDNGDYELCE